MAEEMENQTKIILDSIADGVFTIDSEWKITSFNQAAEKITGILKDEAVGRHCWEVFRASICEECCSLRQTMETGKPVVNQSIFIINSDGEQIPISISTALLKDSNGNVFGGVETFRDLSLVEELRKELAEKHSFKDIISKSKEMRRLFRLLEQISESDTTVLLQGESGTGKELFAKAIHSLSHRKNRPMITINCGSLPDTLLESELFGYKAGAFTDAKKDKPGRLAIAHGGTLFLDEIGDVSPALQVRLLRVLQDKIYEPLGSTKSEKADVRIITATNKDLEKLVKDRIFREDLYYRINVIRLKLPPLRDRKEDIPLLVDYFLKKLNRLKGKDIRGISPDILTELMSHDFPGNIRELENIMEYAMVVCKNSILNLNHLPEYIRPETITTPHEAVIGSSGKNTPLQDQERNFLIGILSGNNWNRTDTAAQLGIHTSTLWRKIKKLEIEAPKNITRRQKK